MTSDECLYLAQLYVPDRFRLAAYIDGEHGVPTLHLRVILDAPDKTGQIAP